MKISPFEPENGTSKFYRLVESYKNILCKDKSFCEIFGFHSSEVFWVVTLCSIAVGY
jgi:hypothetical protein